MAENAPRTDDQQQLREALRAIGARVDDALTELVVPGFDRDAYVALAADVVRYADQAGEDQTFLDGVVLGVNGSLRAAGLAPPATLDEIRAARPLTDEMREHFARYQRRHWGDPLEARYPWADDMDDVSGMHPIYEATCRRMIRGAVAWLAEHRDDAEQPEFAFAGSRDDTAVIAVYNDAVKAGLVQERNTAAKRLASAILAAALPDAAPSVLMVQAALEHAAYAKYYGWPRYQQFMRERKAAGGAAP